MRKKFLSVGLILSLCMAIGLIYAPVATGGIHSLTKWENGKFDLVISLGWYATAADKTKLTQVLELFAQDVWTMTEKNHSIRRLYVYPPNPVTNTARDWNKADIQFLNTADAANAHVAGFKQAGTRIFIDDDMSDINEVGHALAHELVHFAYALYDEYKKDNQPPRDGSPQKDDTPRDTLMNQHWTWQNLSIPADYADATKRATAQYRMYGESAWETLISPVADDSLWALLGYLGYKNKRFAFTDLQSLNAIPAITGPVDNPAVEIIWMEGSEAVIIIDVSGSMGSDGKMAMAQSGAKAYLDKLVLDNDYSAIIKFSSGASVVGALAKLDAAKKTEFKTIINGMSASGGTNIGAALNLGLNTLSGSVRKGTFKYIILLTDGVSSGDPLAPVPALKAENIPVFAIGLGPDADMDTLRAIASGTQGKAYYGASAAALNAIYSDIASITTDDKLTARIKDNLNVSGKNTVANTVVVDSSAKKAVFTASFPTGDTMEMTITRPNGDPIDASNVANYTNIEGTFDAGYINYVVTNPMAGEWKMNLTVINFAGTSDSEVIVEAKTDSEFSIALSIKGGNYPAPILLAATVSRNYPITGLAVTANITAPDGTQSTLDLKDDGVPPDAEAADGLYTGVITNYQDGDYQFGVTASNAAGNATETSSGVAIKQGSPATSVPISGDFQLMEVSNLTSTGVATFTQATDFAGAQALTVGDDLTPGVIQLDEDINYYSFDAIAGTSYTIYTNGLFPTTMKTLLKIYSESDTTTALQEDTLSMNKVAAKIIFEATANEKIYVTVQHGSPGTGIYSLGTRISQATDALDKPGPAVVPDPDPDPVVGGGGCFLNSMSP